MAIDLEQFQKDDQRAVSPNQIGIQHSPGIRLESSKLAQRNDSMHCIPDHFCNRRALHSIFVNH